MTTLPHHSLATTRDQVLDLIGCNHEQRVLLANNTPERDSVLEHVLHWQRVYGVPAFEIATMLTLIRTVIQLNDAEYEGERVVAGRLDDLATTAHRAEGRPVRIKDLADQLRGPLAVLTSPAGHRSRGLLDARRALMDVVRITPRERLLSPSLRHELRAVKHDYLTAFVEASHA